MRQMPTLAAALVAAILAAPMPAPAGETAADPLRIEAAWSRPGLPNRPAVAYLTVHNSGATGDRIVAAQSPEFGAIELHTVERDGDVMRMRPVEAIEVPAGGMATLAPGGFHLMLFEGGPFAAGESFPLTLVFAEAGEVTVEVTVARSAPDGHDGMDHGTH